MDASNTAEATPDAGVVAETPSSDRQAAIELVGIAKRFTSRHGVR